MTALVGVLNKRGAAIAADSAILVSGNGHSKILNNEQKIFRLSDQNPVGVMICNNLNFLTTPWALLFENYKAERGNRTFPTLTGYVTDLLDYLKTLKRLQTDAVKNLYYQLEFEQMISTIMTFYEEEKEGILEDDKNISEKELSHRCFENALNILSEITYEEEINELLKNFTKKEFLKEVIKPNKEFFDLHRKELSSMTGEEWKDLLDCFHRSLQNNVFVYPQGSEIIFVGYGEEDIFPSSQRLFISGMVGKEIKYSIEEISEITLEEGAEIRPFAQTDVMDTLMSGVSPLLFNEMKNATIEIVTDLMFSINDKLHKYGVSSDIIEKIEDFSIKEVNDKYKERLNNFIHEKYINGILQAVEFFNLEEMASMAENLIAVTNLQRHISSTEETVGGPVEVAVITRYGGFKWIKHNNFLSR